MTQEFDWGDGSGEKFSLTFGSAEGPADVAFNTPPNTSETARQKTVTVRTTLGGLVTKVVTLIQRGAEALVHSVTPSAFVSGSYASISGQTNPVGKDENSTSYATVNLKTGNAADTTAFWKFDCSAIPADATIVSVECRAKAMTQQAGGNRVTTYEMQLYKGTTTAKGSSTQLTTSAAAYDLTCGTWTRAELDDINLRLHAVRGKNSTTTTYYLRFYGATLTVKYRV